MKIKTSLSLLVAVLFSTVLCMAKSNDGQKKYDEGLYQEAAEWFEKDFEATKSEESFVKGLQSRLMLKEFENTLKKAMKAPKFSSKQWNILHQIIYLKSIEKFVNAYSYQMARTEIKGETEPIKRTAEYWRRELKRSVLNLLKEDTFLLGLKLETVKSFFYYKDIDIDAMPTVYDWLVNEVISNYYWGVENQKDKLAAIEKGIVGTDKYRSYIRDYWRMMYSKSSVPTSGGGSFYFDPNANGVAPNPPDFKTTIAELAKVANKLETPRGRGEWLVYEAKYYGRFDPKTTLSKCREAVEVYKGVSTTECLNIIRQIENKEVQITKNRFNSKSDLMLPTTTRNLREVWIRVFKTETADIEKNFAQLKISQNRNDFTESELKKMVSQKPLFVKKFSIEPKSIYLNQKSEFNLGKQVPGLYRVVISDAEKIEPGKSFVQGAEIRISDIQLLYQLAGVYDPEKSLGETEEKRIPSHHFYVFDNESGKLLSEIPMKGSIQKEEFTRKTDKDGSIVLNDIWDFQNKKNNSQYSSVIGLAQIQDSVSSYRNDYVYRPVIQFLKYVVEFDRPIYRPGQKINIKATLLKRVPFGFRVLPAAKVVIKVLNPQYETVAEKTIDTNPQGAISWAYDLPMTGMLGYYQVQLSATSPEVNSEDYSRNFSDSFRVEEYKRPDYFVQVEKSKDPWVFDKEVSIKVAGKYYYGAPVKKGRLVYKISSQVYYPWYFDSGYSGGSEGGDDFATGEAVLDDKGEYTIKYTPKSKGSDSRRFVVTASVFDESGRSIDGTASYTASTKEFFINSIATKDFFRSKEKPTFTVKLEDLNGALFDGKVDYEVFELAPPTPDEKKKLKAELAEPVYSYGYRYRGGYGNVDLKRGFEKLATKSMAKGTWSITKDKSEFGIRELAEGVYKIKMHSKDSHGQKVDTEVYLMVAENGVKLSKYYIPEVTLLSKSEFKLGETVSILFGSSEYSGHVVGFLMKNQLQIENPVFKTNQGVKVYDVKVTESMFNGSSFTWFSVFDNEIIQGRVMINVNNEHKKLDVKFHKTSSIKPGQNSQLKIMNKSKAAGLEAMVLMYDQSLEFYASRNHNYLSEIYQNRDGSQNIEFQHEYLSALALAWVHPDLKSMLEKFKKNKSIKYRPLLLIDADRLQQENDYALGMLSELEGGSDKEMVPGRNRMHGAGGIAAAAPMMSGSALTDSASPAESGVEKRRKSGESEIAKPKGLGSTDTKPIEVRKNFAETAVFEPFFNISKEMNKLDFKAPDQLTAWKAKLLAISNDGRIGEDEQVILSQKDFFVRVLVTRYLREGDNTEIKLKVDNMTSGKMSAGLSLEVNGDGIDASELFKGQNLKKTVEIAAGDSYTQAWKIKVPSVLGAVKIKGIVTVGKDTDAEEKTISILPSRQRLIENTLVSLKEKQNILKLRNWDRKDATRVNELVSLQIDPQLPIMLLNSVPSLINYPYSCSEQLINKYVPLAIINSMYQKNPQLQDAVKKALAKTGTRKTVTLPWEEKDPRRLMELTETPWIANSKGMTSPYELISYLDAKTIEKLKEEIFKDLKSRQLPSGGFSWFSGGREDLYITLIVLEGLSEAAMYGVPFPKDLFEKALNYVYGELPKYLKAQIGEMQFLIYGMYVFTSFDSKLNKLSDNKQIADVWVPFIEKHATLITPLGHAYMAHIYKRIGNIKKSDSSLKRALDGGKNDELTGYSWAPEERSWLWYNDTVEKHAFFLQTLIQLKPSDDRIDAIAQWLLFNRKGNEWKSTKATSKAIFSLMHYLKARTNFKYKTQLAIEWGSKKETLKLDPLDIDQKEPLRILKTENIKPNDGEVKITKTGALPVFAGLTWIYSSDEITDASGSSVMDLKREFYLVKPGDKLTPLKVGDKLTVGDEIEVLLTIKSKSQLEYVHLKDPRGAGFESNSLLSGYQWSMIGRYEEPRDSLMNFFFDNIPKGEYMMKHRFKATTAGIYKFNSATIQSMYAPEMTAFSSSFRLEVVEK
tara:strand:+ start:92165 stop:98101 length:5937 start_codon:yes stop_codon:yes gene_type:complete